MSDVTALISEVTALLSEVTDDIVKTNILSIILKFQTDRFHLKNYHSLRGVTGQMEKISETLSVSAAI